MMTTTSSTLLTGLLVWFAILLTASSPAAAGETKAADQPHLVFIIAADLTFRDLSCYGGQAHTPHLDRLATQGMLFERCFQTAPMCSPTRHTIYTGLYPVRSGAYPNHTRAYPDTRSIVQYLQPLGYRVVLSGKTHIGPRSVFPFEYHGGKNPSMPKIDQLFQQAAREQKPIALFACSNEPHTPWNKGDASRYPAEKVELPPYWVDTPRVRQDFSRYLAEVTYFDGQVGEILRLLDKHQLAQQTVVMVVSEQGNAFPFAKWTCYDHGLQSAMIVRWPGRVQPGSTTRAMVEYVDICPTLVEAAGGTPAENLDGKSFLPVLEGRAASHKAVVYGLMTTRGIINGSECYPIRSIRSERYKLIWNLSHESTFTNVCTRSEAFQSMLAAAKANGDSAAQTLVRRYQHRPAFELYDIRTDPLEMDNLAGKAEHASTVKRLHEALRAWMRSQGDEGIATELAAHERQGRRRQTR